MQNQNQKIVTEFKKIPKSGSHEEILKRFEETREALKKELSEKEHHKVDIVFRQLGKAYMPKPERFVEVAVEKGESLFDIGTRI